MSFCVLALLTCLASPLRADAAPGLVAAYGFSEGGGGSTADASGNGHTGILAGATWTTQGRFGNALAFSGNNQTVVVADSNALDLTSGMTLSAWVYPTASNGVREVVIKEGAGVDIYNLYARNWRGQPEANVYVAGGNRTAEASVLPVNTWTHLAATYDGTAVKLYVNGVQAASAAQSGAIAVSNGMLRIGGNSLWGEYFQGTIDEVRIYNRALAPAEIQADMNTVVSN
jgi:hypothetical protein